MKRLAVLLPLTLALAGCGSTAYVNLGPDTEYSPLECAANRTRVSGMLLLLAQSVPTASAVPCVRSSPENWTVNAFVARDGRAHLAMAYGESESQTFVVDVVQRCELGSATESPSDQPGLRRYDRVSEGHARYVMDRYYVEPGACTAFHFTGDGAHAADTAVDVAGTFDFVKRDALDRQVRQFTDGRLHLDPESTR